MLLTVLIASSVRAGGLYYYELGNPDVGAANKESEYGFATKPGPSES
jgi:hypothetical protein